MTISILVDGKPVNVKQVSGVYRYNAKTGTYVLQFELPKTKTLQAELGYPKQDTEIILAIPQ